MKPLFLVVAVSPGYSGTTLQFGETDAFHGKQISLFFFHLGNGLCYIDTKAITCNFFHIRDLKRKIYVPERNELIVDVYNKRTVVFCASAMHAEQIAEMFSENGMKAVSVSGVMKQSERKEFHYKYVKREIQVLCACDLLNDDWDCAAFTE